MSARRLLVALACASSLFIVAPAAASAACTPAASAPTVVGGQIFGHGSISCNVGTSYKYQLCLQQQVIVRGGSYWSTFSCSSVIAWSGSVTASYSWGSNCVLSNGILNRSALTLWFPGSSPQTVYSSSTRIFCP